MKKRFNPLALGIYGTNGTNEPDTYLFCATNATNASSTSLKKKFKKK